ncbi:MAG: HDOD domain-containing protein [Betaproteobacteria bacterium]|nr:HDOD domain-containing protein [Betaproteobacteria bacterium]
MEPQEQSVIARLIKRMDSSPGFAGLGATVQLISRLGDDADGGTREITAAILRDAALAAKLLRMSNSSHTTRGGRNVSTIDQALVILGLNTVKSVALSLTLLESLSHEPQSRQLHAEIVAAYFCGCLAAEITRLYAPRFSTQEAQVCGLMQNLGRMMATYYLYEDIERSHALQAERNLAEDEAVALTLGASYREIGAAIAKHWNLPDGLQNSLATDIGKAPPRSAANAQAWHQFCSAFCRRVTDTLFRLPVNRERVEIARDIEFFRGALHLRDDEVREAIDKFLLETDEILAEMSFPGNVEQSRNQLRKGSERVLDLLSSQDSLGKESKHTGGRPPIEIIQHVLRLIHDKYSFDRTLMCLPDTPSTLVAIAGVGRNAVQVSARFRCHGPKPDLFRAIMARNLDTFVADVRLPMYAKLIPDWYHEAVGARSVVMLPIAGEEKVLGMIYGDYSEPHASIPPGLAEGNMREWRDQLAQVLQTDARKLV